MKHFKIIGPETTTEFDIEDNQMLDWYVVNAIELGLSTQVDGVTVNCFEEQNRKEYPTEKEQ